MHSDCVLNNDLLCSPPESDADPELFAPATLKLKLRKNLLGEFSIFVLFVGFKRFPKITLSSLSTESVRFRLRFPSLGENRALFDLCRRVVKLDSRVLAEFDEEGCDSSTFG